jgi:hypothetical protein
VLNNAGECNGGASGMMLKALDRGRENKTIRAVCEGSRGPDAVGGLAGSVRRGSAGTGQA